MEIVTIKSWRDSRAVPAAGAQDSSMEAGWDAGVIHGPPPGAAGPVIGI